MSNPLRRRIIAVATVLTTVTATLVASTSGSQATGLLQPEWSSTWGAAITGPSATPGGISFDGLTDSSVRMLVRTSVGGDALRLRFSNAFGRQAVVIGHASVALPDTATPEPYDVKASSVKELKFNGGVSATMYKGGDALSDPINMNVGALQELVVTLYLPGPTGSIPWHWQARRDAYVYTGDHTNDASGAGFFRVGTNYYYLAGVDVRSWFARGTVVTYGDSITDGFVATYGTYHRWPDFLAERIVNTPPHLLDAGVINSGISGNQITHDGPGETVGVSGLARLDPDIFGATNVRSAVVMLGINDILIDDPADRVINGLRQLNSQLHNHGIKMLVCTITPIEGYVGFTPAREAVRQQVNAFLRASTEFDAVVDVDAALRDPAQPTRLLPAYDSGDHIHPSDAGNQAFANTIPLNKI